MVVRFIKFFYYKLLNKKKELYLKALVKRGLQLGRNVRIMDGFFFDPSHCFLISIGDNCTLAPNVRLIAHDASMKSKLDYTRIGKIDIGVNCFLGDSVVVLPGVRIGDNSIVGSASVVTKDIPAASLAVGNPCRVIGNIHDFLRKHQQGILNRTTPFFEIDQNRLTHDQRVQILEFLSNGSGYIK